MTMTTIPGGGVTTPKGYVAGACYVGVKSHKSDKPDVAVLCSQYPATCAALFTTNKFCAAPVILGREILKKGKARAFVINSGNANAATGQQGVEDARRIQRAAEAAMDLGEDEVFVCSTGVIGQRLPVDKIVAGMEQIVPQLRDDKGSEAAWAIMTTDTVRKEVALEVQLSGGTIRMGAMAKGSGMIHPNMATMLAYITTDAGVEASVAQGMLKSSADKSFNMTTVDGDTSTNDSVFLVANGASGVKVESQADQEIFAAALDQVCIHLARAIASDGEGATHLMVVEAKGLPTLKDARLVARSIAGSNLFKAAVFGRDANWGRIMTAAGYSGADLDPSHADCALQSTAGRVVVMEDGKCTDYSEEFATQILTEHDVTIQVDFHSGDGEATAYGCDLTYEYVRINGDYRT